MRRTWTPWRAIGRTHASRVIGLLVAINFATLGNAGQLPEDLASREWWTHRAASSVDNIADDAARSEAHHGLALALGRIGELESAAGSAAKVTNPQQAMYALTFVARQYHQRGDTRNAALLMHQAQQLTQAANETTNPFFYSQLIRDYVTLGLTDEALALAESMPTQISRETAFQDVAAATAKAGDLSLALNIVDHRIADSFKSAALVAVGIGCVQGGHVADAQTIAEKLPDATQRDRVYAALASTFVDKGQVDDARDAVDRIESSELRNEVDAKILAKRAETQGVAEIRATVARLRSRDEKLAVSMKLIERLTAEKKLAEADDAIAETVKLIQSEPREELISKFGRFGDDSAVASVKALYLPIAEVMAAEGDLAGAKQHIQMAASVLVSLPESATLVKWIGCARLVSTQIKVGDLNGARETLAKLPAGFGRANPAGNLSAALADSGDVKSAIEVAQSIAPGVGSGTSLAIAAAALCRAGNCGAANSLIEGITDAAERGRAYQALGHRLVESGDGEKLADWLDAVKSDEASTFASLGAAEVLGQEQAQ